MLNSNVCIVSLSKSEGSLRQNITIYHIITTYRIHHLTEQSYILQ